MKRFLFIFITGVLLLSGFARDSFADSGSLFGVRAGLYTDIEEPFIGAEFLTGLAPSFDFNPNIEYVLIDNMSYMTFNIDAHYDFYERTGGFVYFGGGLAITYVDIDGPIESETDTGFNLLVGTGLNRKPVIPYAQAKIVLGDYDEFVINLGIRF